MTQIFAAALGNSKILKQGFVNLIFCLAFLFFKEIPQHT